MKFSMDNETRECSNNQNNTNKESSSRGITEEERNRATLNLNVEESVVNGNENNESLSNQKGTFTRLAFNRWKCVFLHNSSTFNCSICDASCRSYQKLKHHQLNLFPVCV